jgi:hypothetical protein
MIYRGLEEHHVFRLSDEVELVITRQGAPGNPGDWYIKILGIGHDDTLHNLSKALKQAALVLTERPEPQEQKELRVRSAQPEREYKHSETTRRKQSEAALARWAAHRAKRAADEVAQKKKSKRKKTKTKTRARRAK